MCLAVPESAVIQATISKPDTATTSYYRARVKCSHSLHWIHYNGSSNIAEEIWYPGILKDPTQRKPELKLFFPTVVLE